MKKIKIIMKLTEIFMQISKRYFSCLQTFKRYFSYLHVSNDTKERIADYTLAIIIGVALAAVIVYGW